MKDGVRMEDSGSKPAGPEWIWAEPCLVVRERGSAIGPIARGRVHPVWQVLRALLVGFFFGSAILGLLYFCFL